MLYRKFLTTRIFVLYFSSTCLEVRSCTFSKDGDLKFTMVGLLLFPHLPVLCNHYLITGSDAAEGITRLSFHWLKINTIQTSNKAGIIKGFINHIIILTITTATITPMRRSIFH